jgi:hypothetical protein
LGLELLFHAALNGLNAEPLLLSYFRASLKERVLRGKMSRSKLTIRLKNFIMKNKIMYSISTIGGSETHLYAVTVAEDHVSKAPVAD